MGLLLGGRFSKGGIMIYVLLSFVILGFSFFEDAMFGTDMFVNSQIKYMLWAVLPVVICYGLWSFFKKKIEENNEPEVAPSSGVQAAGFN